MDLALPAPKSSLAMIQVSKLLPQGQGLAPVLLKRATTVELDWDVRQKSRFDATDSEGRKLGVFLPRGTLVRGGDVLVSEDGSLVKVIAAPQAVLVITACADHGTPFDLTRAAYHLGNRHVALQVGDGWLRLLDDYVLKAMLEQLGAHTETLEAPFQPEHGAYGGGHHHSRHGDEDFNYPPKLHQFGVRL